MADQDTQTPGAPPQASDTAPAGTGAEPPDAPALRAERDQLYDRLLRKTAEFDNFRKRVERERREHADQAVVDLLLDLLGVVDDFDLALEALTAEGAGVTAYRKGLTLIHAKLHDVLRKQGVRAIESVGTDFDPNLHQAVSHEESPIHREGQVMGEMRRGYMIRDRLLRPAMVKVAKA